MMKRICAVAIILLTLLPLSGISDATALYAQNFAYENGSYWIPDITVTGNYPSKVKCDCCGETFEDEEAFARHLKYNAVCASYYYSGNEDIDDSNDDDAPLDGYCCFCGLPITLCSCTGVDVPGSNRSNPWSAGGGIVGGEGGIFGCTTTSQNPSNTNNKIIQENRKKSSLNRVLKFVSKTLKLILEKMDKAGMIVLVDYIENAQYDQNTKKIYFGTEVEFEGFMHEVIHLAQDENGMLSYENNSSNNEFQTYLLNQICMKVNGESDTNVPTLEGIMSYDTFVDDIETNAGIDRNGLWYNQELIDILNEYGNNWGEVFYYNTSNLGYSGSNTHSYDVNYNYNWQAILEYLGFRQK